MLDTARAVLRTIARAVRPMRRLTVTQWADRWRVLSPRVSPEPGRWRTSRVPYMAEIMDALAPSHPAREVVFMKGSQIAGTEAGINWLGYVIDHAPGPTMFVSPTETMAKRTSRQRVDPMIDDSPRLSAKVTTRKSRTPGNTTLMKEFPGGLLVLTGANSAAGLRSMPARNLFLDEVDAYPYTLKDEGDPVALALRATRNFNDRKVFHCSTPKVRGLSRIEREFERSDKRKFFVPCPLCDERQELVFEQLRWNEEAIEGARSRDLQRLALRLLCVEYECRHCGGRFDETAKARMLPAGEWRATAEGEPGVVGFHLSALYSPLGWFPWSDVVLFWLRAQRHRELLAPFYNTVLGLPFQEATDAPPAEVVKARAEPYEPGTVPPRVLFLTAGADVQRNRIEVEVVGWGRDRESWSIDYAVIDGDTETPAPWLELDRLLARPFPLVVDPNVTLPIRVLAVDSGYIPPTVYRWARRHPQASAGPAGASAKSPRTVIAVKGIDTDGHALVKVARVGARVRARGIFVWRVAGAIAKSELYAALRIERGDPHMPPPPGFCHFPQRYDLEFYQQLTSERRTVKFRRGYPVPRWEKDPGVRNEALDARVYARAAAHVYGLDRFGERAWETFEAELPRAHVDETPVDTAPNASETDPGNNTVPPRSPGKRPRSRRMYRLRS